MVERSGFTWTRRSVSPTENDTVADVILLDSIGELRAAYPLAEIVFVGGSLIPHGGQSIFEPASAGNAIVTGPYVANFEAALREFNDKDAIIQLPKLAEAEIVPRLVETFTQLLADDERLTALGDNALEVMELNRGAVDRTLEYLAPLLKPYEHQ